MLRGGNGTRAARCLVDVRGTRIRRSKDLQANMRTRPPTLPLRAPAPRANFETLKSVYPLSHRGSLGDCPTNRLARLIPPFVAKCYYWLRALGRVFDHGASTGQSSAYSILLLGRPSWFLVSLSQRVHWYASKFATFCKAVRFSRFK